MSWLSIDQAADYAGVKPRTIRRWINKGLKVVRPSSKITRTRQEWVDHFLMQFVDDEVSPVDSIVDEICGGL